MEIVSRSNKIGTADSEATVTRALLACGALFGPLFFVVAFAQMPFRAGFDIRHLAISVLTLGDLGWIQSANFEVTGLLILAFAVGLRRALAGGRAGTWAPILLALAAIGTIGAGIFHPDPGLGFPPGAPAGMPTTMSVSGTIHQLAAMVTFICSIATSFVMGRKFAGDGRRGWAVYCVASGVVAPALLVLALSDRDWVGILLASMVAVAFGCISAAAARLTRDTIG